MTSRISQFVRVEEEFIPFCEYPIFILKAGWVQLTFLKILANGNFILENNLLGLKELKELFRDGKCQTSLNDDFEGFLRIETGRMTISDVNTWVNEFEFYKEVDDIRNELNELPTSSDRCRSIFREFQLDPSEENRSRLKFAYNEVPEHLRVWLVSFDEKDNPIRRAIFGDGFNNQ